MEKSRGLLLCRLYVVMNNTRILLISGVSSGLGRAFAQAALAAGHSVVGPIDVLVNNDALKLVDARLAATGSQENESRAAV